MKHQFPKPDEICELMQFKRAEFDAKKRRPVSALRIYDLRDIARRRTPRAAFDYADGAAERELSLARARQTFEGIQFHPQFLRDVSHVDTSATIFGGPAALPFGIAPTGFTRLVQTEGELAGTGATAAGIPFTHSTLASISIEDVRAANPDGRGWFQTRPRPCSPPTTGAPSALTGQSAPGGERHARRLRRLRTGRRAGLPLTVVAYDTSKLGRRGAEPILERAEERKRGTSSPARRIVVPTTLITSGAER